jgi:hypothetical protein
MYVLHVLCQVILCIETSMYQNYSPGAGSKIYKMLFSNFWYGKCDHFEDFLNYALRTKYPFFIKLTDTTTYL